jgi:hypothetical protein
MKTIAILALAVAAILGSAVGGFAAGQSTRTTDAEVSVKVAAAVQREDARSDRAQAIAVKQNRDQVKATMARRGDRRAARARKAGYERGTSDATSRVPAPVRPQVTTEGNYTSAQLDSFAEGGDGSHDSEGYATGEGCSDNPALPMPSC